MKKQHLSQGIGEEEHALCRQTGKTLFRTKEHTHVTCKHCKKKISQGFQTKLDI